MTCSACAPLNRASKPARHIAASILLAAMAPALAAQSLEEALGGFDDTPAPAIETSSADGSLLPEGLTGSIAVSSSWNYLDHDDATGRVDWQGLSKLRTRLNLQYDTALSDDWKARVSGYGFYDAVYALRDRDDYPDTVLSAYEDEAEIQEAWLQGKLASNLDIKIGRQIVNWGRSDNLRVLDILNPLDNREPGLTDIEDIRLPVGMIKADAYRDEWTASLIAIPEVRFSKNPPLGNDFYTPFSLLPGNALRITEDEPEDFSDTSWAASLTGIFSGWDISFNAAHTWRDQPYLAPAPFNGNALSTLAQSTLAHSRITMVGAGGNITQGSWLFKWEAAYIDGMDYTTATPVTTVLPGIGLVTIPFPTGSTETARVDVLAGVEFFGIANTTLSLEMVNRHIRDFSESMAPFYEQRDRMETALRATHSMLHDRLNLTAVGIAFGERAQDGSLVRLQAEYEWMDGLNVTGGIVTYQRGDLPPFTFIEDNDRVFAEVKYSF
ncbi:MAG: DUF1302 family protein [Gammaproteobacteria bacterium]|nr:MAG: DUF1302 family protein [Gammaproteobacteria bacterium]